MKLSYKQKLFLYFLFIFTLFTAVIVGLERVRETKFKTVLMEEKLDAYAEIINTGLGANTVKQTLFLDSIVRLLPSDIRISLITRQGNVLYDNTIDDISALENHIDRPEVKKAFENGKGMDTRLSASNNQKYLY